MSSFETRHHDPGHVRFFTNTKLVTPNLYRETPGLVPDWYLGALAEDAAVLARRGQRRPQLRFALSSGATRWITLAFKAYRLLYHSRLESNKEEEEKYDPRAADTLSSVSFRVQAPHGGARPFNQKSTCPTQLTLGP